MSEEAYQAAQEDESIEQNYDSCPRSNTDVLSMSADPHIAAGYNPLCLEARQTGYTQTPQKIEDFMAKMGAYRHILAKILDFCRKPRTSTEVDDYLKPLQEKRRSVYTPIVLRDLLHKSGSLANIASERDDLAEQVDDAEYLSVPEGLEAIWLTTEEGVDYLDSNDEHLALTKMINEDAKYREIYLRILAFCNDEGKTASEIGGVVDSDPLVQNPQRYSAYFVGKLEECGALTWQGEWRSSVVGADYMSTFFEGNN